MELVKTASNHCDATPYTTPEIVAEAAQVSSSTIEAHLKNHAADFHKHGNPHKSKMLRHGEGTAPNHLNEAQTMLLLSYLKDSDNIKALRNEYIAQFSAINSELADRRAQKNRFYTARQERTILMRELDVVGDYAELAYMMAFGKSSKTVRSEYHIPGHSQAIDYLPTAELSALTDAQVKLSKHLRAGHDYKNIKSLLTQDTAGNEMPSDEVLWQFIAKKLIPFLPCGKCSHDNGDVA